MSSMSLNVDLNIITGINRNLTQMKPPSIKSRFKNYKKLWHAEMLSFRINYRKYPKINKFNIAYSTSKKCNNSLHKLTRYKFKEILHIRNLILDS